MVHSAETGLNTSRGAETGLNATRSTETGLTNTKHPAKSLLDSIITRTKSGRLPKKTVFSDAVIQLVSVMKAVHCESTGSGIPTPLFESVTIEEAMREDALEWKKAIYSELQSLKDTNTYKVVESPRGRKIIPSKWVLRRKFDYTGQLARRKARIVIKGYEQRYGIDYFNTFASVLRYSTLRALLAVAAAEDLEIDQMDVDTAFLNPLLKEEIYMEIPEYFELLYPNIDFKGKCLRLMKSLYGLKQAPREWFLEVRKHFKTLGFIPLEADPNLFRNEGLFILLFVDDMLLIGKRQAVDRTKALIGQKWKCKDLKEAKLFVGFQIERNRKAKSLKIHQTLYSTKLLERFKLDRANPSKLPIPAGTVLKRIDESQDQGNASQPLEPTEIQVYQQIVGSLIYLSNGT